MDEFLAQLRGHLLSPLRIVAIVSAAVLLGITGPFGTFMSLNFFERLAYWSAIVLISILFVQVIKVLVDINFLNMNWWKKGLLVSILLTVLLAPSLNFMTDAVIGQKSMYDTPLWVFAALTFSLTILVIFLQYLMGIRTFKTRPRLFSRFEDQKADGIMWITVRDHYVDVHTNRGVETLLMRFSDALAELDGMVGLQVHRSHWVASCAVVELKKANGRSFIVLQNGTEVPISRGYLEAAAAKFG